jgi:hypothetical protein
MTSIAEHMDHRKWVGTGPFILSFPNMAPLDRKLVQPVTSLCARRAAGGLARWVVQHDMFVSR